MNNENKQLSKFKKAIKSRLDILPKSTKQIRLREGISGRLKANQIIKARTYLSKELEKVKSYEKSLLEQKNVIPKLQDKRDTDRTLKGINPYGQDKVIMSIKRKGNGINYRW